jgi:hypothetical protein
VDDSNRIETVETDEDILTYDASDETLEVLAGVAKAAVTYTTAFFGPCKCKL